MHKNLVLLSLASFFTDSASSMVNAILPLYLIFILGESEDKLGIVVGVSTFVSYFFRILFGYLSDRLERQKPFLIAGYTISAITKPLFAFSSGWVSVAILKSLERLGKAVRTAPRDKFLSSLGKEKGKIYGFHKTFDVGGETFGTVIALLSLYLLNSSEETYRLIFLMTAPFGILAVILVLFLEEKGITSGKRETFKISEVKSFIPIFFISLFPLFMWNEAFFLVEVKKLGYPDWNAPLFLLLTGLTQTLLGYPIGKLIDKTSPLTVYSLSLMGGFLSVFLLILKIPSIAFVLLGVSLVSFFNSVRSYIAIKFKGVEGTAFGVFYFLYALLGAIGGVVIGFLISHLGENLTFIYTAFGISLLFLILNKLK